MMCLKEIELKLVEIEKHNREERKKIMDDMQEKHDSIMRVLSNFNGARNEPINYKDLIKFPKFKWVSVNDKVSVRRRNMLFDDHINFDTKIKKNGEFSNHFHNDVIESAEVMSGRILDETDGTVYKKGDVMSYGKSEKHKPIALDDSVLKVIFKP